MLTAWDSVHNSTLVLPDYERQDDLERVRTRTRLGELVCPTCQQALWLRAGEVRTPHFGHRSLNNCPQARVSEAVLAARRQLYRFFRSRIDAAKLPGEVELEPRVPELEQAANLDLLLRRTERRSVAVLLVETSLKPEVRGAVLSTLETKGWLFRPAFLATRLKAVPETEDEFLLDTTGREFRLKSAYDLRDSEFGSPGGTLHFIDAQSERWTTLRGLLRVHYPQVFAANNVRVSAMKDLLWSEGHGEWVHPGEAEALQAFREAQAAEEERRRQAKAAEEEHRRQAKAAEEERRQKAKAAEEEWLRQVAALEEERRRKSPERQSRFFAPAPSRALDTAYDQDEEDAEGEQGLEAVEKADAPEHPPARDPLPAWIAGGLVCVGCGQRTGDWQNASPGKDMCVCRTCFGKGVRLPSGSATP